MGTRCLSLTHGVPHKVTSRLAGVSRGFSIHLAACLAAQCFLELAGAGDSGEKGRRVHRPHRALFQWGRQSLIKSVMAKVCGGGGKALGEEGDGGSCSLRGSQGTNLQSQHRPQIQPSLKVSGLGTPGLAWVSPTCPPEEGHACQAFGWGPGRCWSVCSFEPAWGGGHHWPMPLGREEWGKYAESRRRLEGGHLAGLAPVCPLCGVESHRGCQRVAVWGQAGQGVAPQPVSSGASLPSASFFEIGSDPAVAADDPLALSTSCSPVLP